MITRQVMIFIMMVVPTLVMNRFVFRVTAHREQIVGLSQEMDWNVTEVTKQQQNQRDTPRKAVS